MSLETVAGVSAVLVGLVAGLLIGARHRRDWNRSNLPQTVERDGVTYWPRHLRP